MRTSSAPRWLAFAAVLLVVLSADSWAEKPELPERVEEPRFPKLCEEAMAADPDDPIPALRKAEAEYWRAARRAGKAAQREMSRSLAVGPGAAPGMSAGVEAASADYFGSIRLAKVLCGCRLELGDAEPDECARRYPVR